MGGAVAFGAAAGGFIGSGPGAAGGAAMAVAVVSTSKLVDAIVSTRLGFAGPDDNWIHCETGFCDCKQICFGTYKKGDSWYWKTYWTKYVKGSQTWIMSAGQAKDTSF